MGTIDYAQLAAAMLDQASSQKALKHDLPAGFSLTTNYMHGPTGIFGVAGVERDVFSTRVRGQGLASALNSVGTVDTNPIQAYLTGFTDESGDEADGVCDEPPEAGEIKSCMQGTVFGRVSRKTEALEINTVGRRTNRGEFMDLQLVNDPLLEQGFFVPSSVPSSTASVLNREVLARWLMLGVAFENKLSKMLYTGTPVNNSANGGYKEFYGIESLVKTGHVDVITQTSCPSLDSYIVDFNYASAEDSAYSLFYTLQQMWRYVNNNASTMGMNPVRWAWVMPQALFRILTEYWPCVYATGRCGQAGDIPANAPSSNVDAMAMLQMSNSMYNGMYLEIDGVQIPVIVDDYMPVDTNAENANVPVGSFASDIYLIPFTVRGGRQVTYLEYFDYSAANGVMQGISDGRLGNEFWTDGGRFLWTFSRTNWCVSWVAKIEPRLRLLTPHLAARLQNVLYSPLKPMRMPHPDDHYFVNGGLIVRDNAPYTLPQ